MPQHILQNLNASEYWLYVGQKISMYDEAIEGLCPTNGSGLTSERLHS